MSSGASSLIAMELHHWFLLLLLPVLLLHVSETGRDALAVFRALRRMAWPMLTEKEHRQRIREEEALFDMRVKVLNKAQLTSKRPLT